MSDQLTPQTAVDEYVQSRVDAAESTRRRHRYRLSKFLDFTESQEGIDTMADITPRHIERFRQERLNDGNTNLVTVEQSLHTFRVFLRYCERVEICEEGLSEAVIIPNVSSQKKAKDVHISHERATQIIEFLAQYSWASLHHIVFHLTYHTGLRRGALYGLDVEDWNSEERTLEVRHRDNTPLKNDEQSERHLSITNAELAEAINDYLSDQRPEVTDEWGREPFFASKQGRYHWQSLQKVFYKVTRPCFFADECPVGREIEECEGTEWSGYSKCPESVSSHPIRRSAVTHHLDEDVPKAIVSERMNVTQEVLDLHYDARDKEQKRTSREQYLGGL